MRKELAQRDFLKDFIAKAGPTQQYRCPVGSHSTHRRLSGTVMPNRLFYGPHFPSDGSQGESRRTLLQCGSGSCKSSVVCLRALLHMASMNTILQ